MAYTYKKKDLSLVTRNESNVLEIDKELLMTLYRIQAPSNYEHAMIAFIKKYVSENISDVSIAQDKNGNLLITKGLVADDEYYPCVVAHMDEIPEFNSAREIVAYGEFVFSLDVKTGERDGLGADDKNGIYVALEMLKIYPILKVFFSVGEEIGMIGSSRVNTSFFDNVGYMLQCDRRGSSDLIIHTNGIEVTSDEFLYSIYDITEAYGYTEEIGTATDVGELKSRGVNVSACNISCGYYNEHTDDEFCYLPALENCLNFTSFIVENCGLQKYEHTPKDTYKGYGGYGGYDTWANTFYEHYDEWDYEDITDKNKKIIDRCEKCNLSCMACPYDK